MTEQAILKDYELIRELNLSSGRQTWLARDLLSSEQVVIKSQRLSQSVNWKQLELHSQLASSEVPAADASTAILINC